jgi:hypothetical protein
MVRILTLAATVAVAGLLASLGAPGAGASGSGISGRVTSSPTCPVERYPPDPSCAPRGLRADIRVVRLSDRHVVARLTTHADGRFGVRLRPARYSLRARPASGGTLPRCPAPVKKTVRRGHYTRVAIDCDSGIR